MSDEVIMVCFLFLFTALLWTFYLRPKQKLGLVSRPISPASFSLHTIPPNMKESYHFDQLKETREEVADHVNIELVQDNNERKAIEVGLSSQGSNVCVKLFEKNLIRQFCNFKAKLTEELSPDHSTIQGHEGGLSSIQMGKIVQYVRFLEEVRDMPWKQSMLTLKDLIYFDPVLRYNWENGVRQSTNILPGKTGLDVLTMINNVLYTPPSFQNCSVIGVPINAILLEFMQTESGRVFFSHARINQAFKVILNDYGALLQSPASLKFMNTQSPKGWFCSEALEQVDYSMYDCDSSLPHYGFACWNDWFLRNFKPGQRIIGDGTPLGINEENVIVNSCESTPLSSPQQPATNVKITDSFWLKDSKYSLNDMFGQVGMAKNYGSLFQGGTVYQAFLSALCYHNWHAPVDGVVEDIYSIGGTYFLDNSQNLQEFDIETPVESQAFLSATAARMVMLIKADNPLIGYIAIVFIGMVEVSTTVSKVCVGERVKKGDWLGHFMFGGSSHAVLFQRQAKLTFNDDLYKMEEKRSGKLQKMGSYLASISE